MSENKLLICEKCGNTFFQQVELAKFYLTDIDHKVSACPIAEERKYVYFCSECGFIIDGKVYPDAPILEIVVVEGGEAAKVRYLKRFMIGRRDTIICHTLNNWENIRISMPEKHGLCNFVTDNPHIIEYGYNKPIISDSIKHHIILLTKNEWDRDREKILEAYQDHKIMVREGG